ncbi:MAG: DNA translocase FtsK, partial [Oscillospiraceae bacterium]|nr:DNA translocase FtsK [Oscillospiraceae bacterium]
LSLLLSAVILFFHNGRPVRLRVLSAFVLTIIITAMIHLFVCRYDYIWDKTFLPRLWSDGQIGTAGGVLGGFLSVSFETLFSTVGAAIALAIIALFFALTSVGRTAFEVADALRTRCIHRKKPVPGETDSVRPVPGYDADAEPRARRRRNQPIDIPIGGDDARRDPYKSPAVSPPTLDTKTKRGGISLDIPFIDEHVPGGGAVPLPDSPFVVPDISGDTGRAAREKSAEPEKSTESKPKNDKKEDIIPLIIPDLPASDGGYAFPPLSLLSAGKADTFDATEEMRLNRQRLESAFKSFGVNVKITHTTRGPSVTRYEAELEAGVKLSRLVNLSDDIALALGASGVRIGPMPDKISTVGIEVPNKVVSAVHLRDIIESSEFTRAQSKLTFAIGKNISGEAIVGNIAKLPHMLVAGTTGSGKSVCLNSLILSILYKAAPEEVRFIMIDPKMVELRVYNGIPHLLVPVVTDVKKAAGALQWAVVEMERRYRMMAELNARDLEGYNKAISRPGAENPEKPLPQVVVIIDELADLMMTVGKDVEASIVRVAQKGRAAGIHLVIATQSPRADVITGLMKANIPSRIALKVSSALESRIILDSGGGADKLVGNGDMLFAPPSGASKPVRVQGTGVTDAEREEVVDFVKRGGEAEYSDDIMKEIENAAYDKEDKPDAPDETQQFDELLPEAVKVIYETGQASTSKIQSRLRLGYARGARIIDQLETIGFLGPYEGSKGRQILMTPEQWSRSKYNPTGEIPYSPEKDSFDGYDDGSDDEFDDDTPPF